MYDYTTYAYALLSVSFISLAPVVLLLVLPIDNKIYLKKFLALAAGCLLADAFLHLIPESSHEHAAAHHHHHDLDHGHNHDHEHGHHDHHDHHNHHEHDHAVGLKVLSGIMVFFILEKYIYSINLGGGNSGQQKASAAKKKKDDDHHEHDHAGHIHASGILNLIADFLHNFTDGLAIGASFIADKKIGLSTTLAIFLHEVPHEIGDYAILIQSGFSKKKAIWLQVVTAVGAVSGTIVSLVLGQLDERANAWILPFTAGGFIYIATVHLIPQLKNSTFSQTIVELLFFVIGVAVMYFMSWLE